VSAARQATPATASRRIAVTTSSNGAAARTASNVIPILPTLHRPPASNSIPDVTLSGAVAARRSFGASGPAACPRDEILGGQPRHRCGQLLGPRCLHDNTPPADVRAAGSLLLSGVLTDVDCQVRMNVRK
jgi:hypothetical protein